MSIVFLLLIELSNSPDTMSICSGRSTTSDSSDIISCISPKDQGYHSHASREETDTASSSTSEFLFDNKPNTTSSQLSSQKSTSGILNASKSETSTNNPLSDGEQLQVSLGLVSDTRTQEEFQSNIKEKESLLAEILDLNCLKMDHGEGNIESSLPDEEIGQKFEPDTAFEDEHHENREQFTNPYLVIQRGSSIESTDCSTPSTIKEQSPSCDFRQEDDFYGSFLAENSGVDSSESDDNDLFSKKVYSKMKLRRTDGETLSVDENCDSSERIDSNLSEDRLSCLSYGPPSGSSVPSLTGNLSVGDVVDLSTLASSGLIVGDQTEEDNFNSESQLKSYSKFDSVENDIYEPEIENGSNWWNLKIPDKLGDICGCDNFILLLSGKNLFYSDSNPKGRHWKCIRTRPACTAISTSPDGKFVGTICEGYLYVFEGSDFNNLEFSFSNVHKSKSKAMNVRCHSVDRNAVWYIKSNNKVSSHL